MAESKNEFFKEIKEEFKEFGSKVNRMFEDLVSRGDDDAEFHLAVDVVETNDSYIFSADFPGMAKSDVSLQVRDGQLTIKGVRKRQAGLGEVKFHKKERSFGQFRRSFAIPAGVEFEGVKAKFDLGVLTVTFPKEEAVQESKVEINIEE
ncbi:MAG: Hsp20/alpha crystallin family protein [Bacteroidia bacterium]|nr:Hsp20/alpha crystallin family protein [Bacteroidia bacterium]